MTDAISTDLARFLAERFDATAAADLDVVVGFAWPAQARSTPCPDLVCAIQGGVFEIRDSASARIDFTLYFRDAAHAIALLSAQVSPIEAFMAGEFRSSGYLVWTFRTLGVFTRKA